MNKHQQLQAARELEGDATIGAGAGFGKYTREVSELRRGKSTTEETMERQRTCPACGKQLVEGEMHRAKPFEAHPASQFTGKRFWVCDNTIDSLEALVKTYREANWDQFINVP